MAKAGIYFFLEIAARNKEQVSRNKWEV